MNGVSEFDRLRAAVGRIGTRDAFLHAFDLLEINGTDLRRDAWDERRKVLVRLLRSIIVALFILIALAVAFGYAWKS